MQPGLQLLAVLAFLISQSAVAEQRVISSLGRLEPENGVVQLAGPSGGGLTGAVLKTLEVAEGDWVEKDQVVARLDSYNLRTAEVARLDAILANARSEMARQQDLAKKNLTSQSNLDTAGERVGPEGIMELGRTDRMYAVAEVYETDITGVKVGQLATIQTPAMDTELTGKVERISLKVGRLDVIGTDPIAKTDARVVEVFILLDDSETVSRFTNMQVRVEIQP
jgi:HlyD family secretion protein